MFRLGGQTLFLSPADTQLSRDESIADTARVLSRYLDVLTVRTYAHERVEEMAHWAEIPVINALTDRYHPCQVLSDLVTIKEKRGNLSHLRVAWVGDGNNVAQSWINAAAILGFELVLACPRAYSPPAEALEGMAANSRLTKDPQEAVRGADVINTDVWASMGQEDQQAERVKEFAGFQVDRTLVELAKPDVLVLHCLPAHRGEEISADVLEGPHSVVFDQAENKMHLHQALLEKLLAGR
jgi:ornithine carbamoyltransferase